MLSTQKPLSATSVTVNSTNFPALAHFFPCTETAPQTTGLVDSVGGVTTGVLTNGTGDGSKLSAAGQALHTALGSGSWSTPGTDNIVIVAVGNFSNAILNVGNISTTGGYQYAQSVSRVATYDGTDTPVTVSSTFGNAVEAHVIEQVPSTSLTAYRLQSDGTWGTNGTADTTNIPATVTALNDVSTFGITGSTEISSLYGLAIFYFETLPGDLEEAVQWMYNEWVNNDNKVIYPGWKDRV